MILPFQLTFIQLPIGSLTFLNYHIRRIYRIISIKSILTQVYLLVLSLHSATIEFFGIRMSSIFRVGFVIVRLIKLVESRICESCFFISSSDRWNECIPMNGISLKSWGTFHTNLISFEFVENSKLTHLSVNVMYLISKSPN